MKVYKEKQFLIFDFENGKNVKYNLATHETIGLKGKPVKTLCSQLSGLNIYNIIESCIDPAYGKFLKHVHDGEKRGHGTLMNIGDKIITVKPMGPLAEDTICEVVDVDNDGGVFFRFNRVHLGFANANEIKEYFRKVD